MTAVQRAQSESTILRHMRSTGRSGGGVTRRESHSYNNSIAGRTRRQTRVQHESICVAVVSSDDCQLAHLTPTLDTGDVHNQVNGERNRLANAPMRQADIRGQNAVRKTCQRLLGGIRVNRAQASEMTGVERLKQVEGLGAAYFTYKNAIWPVPECSAKQVGNRDRREWRFLTEHSVRATPDGSFRLHYDPALAVAFSANAVSHDVELWNLYDAVRCPTLVLRGAESDLLSRETAHQMSVRGPRAQVVEIADVGHAPTLLHQDQVEVVKEFLLAPGA